MLAGTSVGGMVEQAGASSVVLRPRGSMAKCTKLAEPFGVGCGVYRAAFGSVRRH